MVTAVWSIVCENGENLLGTEMTDFRRSFSLSGSGVTVGLRVQESAEWAKYAYEKFGEKNAYIIDTLFDDVDEQVWSFRVVYFSDKTEDNVSFTSDERFWTTGKPISYTIHIRYNVQRGEYTTDNGNAKASVSVHGRFKLKDRIRYELCDIY